MAVARNWKSRAVKAVSVFVAAAADMVAVAMVAMDVVWWLVIVDLNVCCLGM